MPRWLLIVLWGVLILTVVDGGYLVYLSLAYPDQYAHANNEYGNNQQSLGGPVVLFLYSFATNFLEFVKRNDEAITALSTIFIAIFTLTLWLATRGLFSMAKKQAQDMRDSMHIAKRSADAAKDSADAMIKAQMPILFPMILDGYGLLPHSPEHRNNHIPSFRFVFHNYGNTPAILFELKYELIFTSGLPESRPWERHTISLDREVIPGGSRDVALGFPCRFYRALTEQEVGEARAAYGGQPEAKRFYFYGEVIYDDVFGYRHIKGFGRKIFPTNRHEPPPQPVRGGEKYEYYRRIDRRTGKEA